MPRASSRQTSSALSARLAARRPELEQAALARIKAISDPDAAPDPSYIDGLRLALATGLDYGLAAIEHPGSDRGPVPLQLLSQARLAARNGVSLDAVLRRYAAVQSLLADALLEEAAAAGVGAAELRVALRALAACFDRVVAAIGEEYVREAGGHPDSPEGRRADRVRRILAGEPLDMSDFAYNLDCWHVATVASGPRVSSAIRDLAARLGCRLLLTCPDDTTAWAWFGSRSRIDTAEIVGAAASFPPERAIAAFGESARGSQGWRLTHQQAAAALTVAGRDSERVVRYAEVSLLATALRDDVLIRSLDQIYLRPLSRGDNGASLRQTLSAYFAASRNVTSTAAALGLSRQTVNNRLRIVEERIGRQLETCGAELQLALELRDTPVLANLTSV